MLTREQLQSAATESGFALDSLEKAWMLVRLLNLIAVHPFMGPRVALKGGTALNLFVFDFLESLNGRGEVEPSLLTSEADKQRRIRANPGLKWKALNVKKHIGV